MLKNITFRTVNEPFIHFKGGVKQKYVKDFSKSQSNMNVQFQCKDSNI